MSQAQPDAGPVVLLVDDNPILLKQAAAYLSQRALTVVTHDSPFGVGRLVLRHRPSIAVLDVMMPGLDGPSLMKVFGELGVTPPPVIFYSAMEEEQLYQICKARPGTAYVLKSDGLPVLYDTIQKRLARG